MTGTLTKLEAIDLVVPLPRPLLLGAIATTERHFVLVRAYDDEGNVGTSYGLGRNAPVAETLRRLVAPRWVGQPLERHPDFYQATVMGNLFLGTNGIFWRALSLADCALYDLLAQRAGQPLGEYLGGTLRPIPVTLAGFYPTADETPQSLEDTIVSMASLQPAGIKVTSSLDYDRDTARMKQARELVPDGPPFIIDLYCMVPDAKSLIPTAQQWDTLNILWLEDPFPFDDFDNLAELAGALPYPVGVGDEQTGMHHFRRMIELGKVGVVRLDATTCGGVRGLLSIAAMAAEHNVPVSTHISHFLHTHLACAASNIHWVEYMLPESGALGIELLWNNDMQIESGCLVPSAAAGVGYDWNEDAIERYRV